MYKCKLCDNAMYQVRPFHTRDQYMCPIHGQFTLHEKGASIEYWRFKGEINQIEKLGFVLAYEKQNIDGLRDILIENEYMDEKIDEVIISRAKYFLDWIRIMDVAALKIAVDRYAINRGYKDTGALCGTKWNKELKEFEIIIQKNYNIVKNNGIQFRKGSEIIPSLGILKAVRDFVVHPKEEKMINDESDDKKIGEYNKIINRLMMVVPDKNDKLSFLHEQVIEVKSDEGSFLQFQTQTNKNERRSFLDNHVKLNVSVTESKLFVEYLREKIQEVILDIDLNGIHPK